MEAPIQDQQEWFWLYPRWLKRPNPDSQTGLFLMAALVGVLGGIGATAFKTASSYAQAFFIGITPDFLEASLRLPWYWKLVIPTLGGLLAGLALFLLPKEAKGHGISEIMEAVTIRRGVLNLRAALVRSLSSLMSIGTGASIGREGPIVQISASLASHVGMLFRLRKDRLSILVGCGVAAGLAAAYNVPIAASFFVMEIIIGNFAIDIFAPLVISSVVSTLVYRKIFGFDPVYGTPHFALISNWELLVYVVLGILSGIAAALFRSVMKGMENLAAKVEIPIYAKAAVGGLLVGAIGILYPHVWGNGFDAVNRILRNDMNVHLLFILFYVKILATALSVGSGASGGVFTPTQFIGAALGGFIGFAVHEAFPQHVALPSAYALVGMGCLMAGTTYAPIMAILMIFEMTLDYEIILPLMLSCILSSIIARQFHRDSIYTEKLRMKGIKYDMSIEESAMRQLHVRELRRADAPAVQANQRFSDVVDIILKSRSNVVYVVEQDGKLVGSINIHDLKEFFNEKDLYSLVLARDVAVPTSSVYPDQSVVDVMEIIYMTDADQVPVVLDPASMKFEGIITRRDIIGAYNREVLRKKALLTKFVTRQKEQEGVDYVEIPLGYRIGRIDVSRDLENKTLAELNFRTRYGLQVLELLRPARDGNSERIIAEPQLQLKRGDSLIVIGTEDDFQKYQEMVNAS